MHQKTIVEIAATVAVWLGALAAAPTCIACEISGYAAPILELLILAIISFLIAVRICTFKIEIYLEAVNLETRYLFDLARSGAPLPQDSVLG